jgi:hypothetical protein
LIFCKISGYIIAFVPLQKKLALALYFCNKSRTFSVIIGMGPSSKLRYSVLPGPLTRVIPLQKIRGYLIAIKSKTLKTLD